MFGIAASAPLLRGVNKKRNEKRKTGNRRSKEAKLPESNRKKISKTKFSLRETMASCNHAEKSLAKERRKYPRNRSFALQRRETPCITWRNYWEKSRRRRGEEEENGVCGASSSEISDGTAMLMKSGRLKLASQWKANDVMAPHQPQTCI